MAVLTQEDRRKTNNHREELSSEVLLIIRAIHAARFPSRLANSIFFMYFVLLISAPFSFRAGTSEHVRIKRRLTVLISDFFRQRKSPRVYAKFLRRKFPGNQSSYQQSYCFRVILLRRIKRGNRGLRKLQFIENYNPEEIIWKF